MFVCNWLELPPSRFRACMQLSGGFCINSAKSVVVRGALSVTKMITRPSGEIPNAERSARPGFNEGIWPLMINRGPLCTAKSMD